MIVSLMTSVPIDRPSSPPVVCARASLKFNVTMYGSAGHHRVAHSLGSIEGTWTRIRARPHQGTRPVGIRDRPLRASKTAFDGGENGIDGGTSSRAMRVAIGHTAFDCFALGRDATTPSVCDHGDRKRRGHGDPRSAFGVEFPQRCISHGACERLHSPLL